MLPPPLFNKESGYGSSLGVVVCWHLFHGLLLLRGDFGIANIPLEEEMMKYVLFNYVGDALVSVTYNSVEDLYKENEGVFERGGLFNDVSYVDPCRNIVVVISASMYSGELMCKELNLDELDSLVPQPPEEEFEDDDVDSWPTDDGWIEVSVNGFTIKVPEGTTTEQIQAAMTGNILGPGGCCDVCN